MSVRSNIDVINAALDYLGTQTISTITDTSKEARCAARHWDISRQSVLRMHPWNFAIARATLNAPNTVLPAPNFGFANRHYLPLDYLRMINLDAEDDWRIEGRTIVSDSTSLELRYVFDNKEVDDYDPIFFDALSLYLAWKMCMTINQSSTGKEQLWKDFKGVLAKATMIDSSEDPFQSVDIDVWMRSRVGPSQGFVRDPQT